VGLGENEVGMILVFGGLGEGMVVSLVTEEVSECKLVLVTEVLRELKLLLVLGVSRKGMVVFLVKVEPI
jgi:hypothetical protein